MTYEEYCEMTDILQSYINDECITMEAACELNNIFYESYVNAVESSNFDKWINAKAKRADEAQKKADVYNKHDITDVANKYYKNARRTDMVGEHGDKSARITRDVKNISRKPNDPENSKYTVDGRVHPDDREYRKAVRDDYKKVYGKNDRKSLEEQFKNKKDKYLKIQRDLNALK